MAPGNASLTRRRAAFAPRDAASHAGNKSTSPDGGYAAVLGHVVGMDTRFFSDEEIHRVHELPHWKDLDNLHHKVSYHLSTKLVARKPPSN